MKLRFFVLLSIMVFGVCGLAGAQSLSLDHTDGLLDADHLNTGVPVTFYLRLTGDGDSHGGATNGFRAYSDDGATWNPMVGDTLGPLGKAQFDGGFFISPFSVTGEGADTIGFGGFRFFGPGLAAGFDDVVYSLDIGPIPESSIGKQICLDSSFYPPSGVWKWAGPDVFPGWDGPHYFTVGPPAACAVAVTSPAGGESWTSGTMHNITYTTTDCAECNTVDISYSVDGGAFTAISTGSTNTGTFSWTVPDVESGNVVVRVCCTGTSDCATSNPFTIEAPAEPVIVSVDPNTAAQCDEGLVVTITGANTDWQSVQGSEVTNPDVFLTHSSGSPTIAASSVQVISTTSVQATFNFAHDAATGLYDVTVDSPTAPPDMLPDGFTVTAAAASAIVLSTNLMEFDADECAPDLGPKSFNVSSESCAHDISVSANVPWLDMPVLDGTTPIDIPLSVNESLMPGPGTHSGWVTVTADGATNSGQIVTVTLVVPDVPAPGGPSLDAVLWVTDGGSVSDQSTAFGLSDQATDCYDAGIDEFEPPAPPGDYIRAYFDHPEWGELQSEFNMDIRSPFSTLCKEFGLTIESNAQGLFTIVLPSQFLVNPGCYKISLLDESGNVLVDNFETMDWSYSHTSFSHNFTIRVCAGGGGLAPSITCPDGPVDAFICGQGQVCIDLPIDNADEVTSSGGGAWADGQLCFTATEPGEYVFGVNATNSCGDDFCSVVVNVSMGSDPVIECPQVELAAERCGPGEVCVPLVIAGADDVVVEGATWADGQLCFNAEASGLVNFNVTATNGCGEAICDLSVNVTIKDVPEIACPDVPITATQTQGNICVDLDIQGAVSVNVDSPNLPATWADGELCFDGSQIGEFTVVVTATNECGESSCTVLINIADCPLPVVDCPSGPIQLEMCELGAITVTIGVTNADQVTVSEGSYGNGVFTFLPDSFGPHEITLTATNACGATECSFVVEVNQPPAVVMTCPPAENFATLCEPAELCLDLPIENADEVVVDGGATWADGQLCFLAEPGTTYNFTVTASNTCGSETCVIDYGVDSYDAPVACFTADPMEGTVPLEVTFSNCSSDDTDEATYSWDFGDGNTSVETSPMHIYESIGCFDVTLVMTDGCGRQSTATETICVTDDQVVTPTDRWINIYCPEPMLEGVPLSPGDIITVYDPDGVLCGMGEVQPDGSYGMILIYADDIYTADVDEGADPGDLMWIHINGVAVDPDSPLIWTENGAVFMVCDFTIVPDETCIAFDLDAGWHLISWNVAYSDDIGNAIADISECVDVVLGFDRGGLTYDPALPEFSTLGSVDYHHGYWLRVSCPVSFEICGGIISPNEAIMVYSGWNLVSYWPEDVLPVDDGFASLLATDNLLVAYGFDGAAADYIPGDPLHQSLDYLYPGFGYWVKVINDDMLEYPGFSGGTFATPRGDNRGSLAASVGVAPSRNWMSVYGANLEVDGTPVRSGATVEVFTEKGVLCGSGVYNDGILKFTSIYGYDAENDRYPKNGDQLNVRIDGERVASDLTYSGTGTRVSLGSLSADDLLPDSYSMAQNYPNPFNPATTISYNLPSAGMVELAVYNVLGQKVATIANGHFQAGTHEAVWNGTDESGSAVGSGIYFYRITTSDFEQTKKMILMK